jgi:hypothetical protein
VEFKTREEIKHIYKIDVWLEDIKDLMESTK